MTYSPNVLSEDHNTKVWTDINGDLWMYDKRTDELLKNVNGQWEPIDSLLIDEITRESVEKI